MVRLTLLVFVVILGVWSFLPIYWVTNISFMTRKEIFTVPGHVFPPNPTFDNHLRALGLIEAPEVGTLAGTGLVFTFQQGIVNSLLIAISVTILTLVIALPAGYAFARFNFRFKQTIFFIILFSRALPPISIVIPYYQFYGAVGIRGTQIGLILVYLTLTVPLITWVMSGFFGTVPEDLDRAARVDGASRRQLFQHIIIPTAAPGIAAAALLTFLTSWNEFVFSLILGQTEGLYTLPPAIAGPLYGVGSDVELTAGIATISLIPPIIGAFFLQKYITQLKLVDPVTFKGRGGIV